MSVRAKRFAVKWGPNSVVANLRVTSPPRKLSQRIDALVQLGLMLEQIGVVAVPDVDGEMRPYLRNPPHGLVDLRELVRSNALHLPRDVTPSTRPRTPTTTAPTPPHNTAVNTDRHAQADHAQGAVGEDDMSAETSELLRTALGSF